MSSTPRKALERAIAIAGSKAALGRHIGVSREAVGQYLKLGRCPVERVLQIEAATGIPRTDLRPDIYPAA